MFIPSSLALEPTLRTTLWSGLAGAQAGKVGRLYFSKGLGPCDQEEETMDAGVQKKETLLTTVL